jgi:trimethylamine--corrinoid protein Co-methyltransferase
MANSYGMPSLVADVGWGRDVQGGIEDVLSPANQLVGILGGSDLVTGLGAVDSAKGISFEQFIIDSYMWDCSKKYLHEVQISEEKIGLDAIREVGHGNDFLTHPHTIKHLRGELASWEQEKLDLLNMDKNEMPAEANKIVKSILDTHQVEAIEDDLIGKGDAIIAEYEARLGNSSS